MLTHIVALSERSSARRATKVNFDNWIGFYMTRNTSMQHYTTAIYIMFCCWMAPPPISRVSSKSHTSAQKRCRYMLYNTWQDTKATAVGIGIGDKSPRNLFFFFFFFFQIVCCVMTCCCLCLDWMAKSIRREMAYTLHGSYLYTYNTYNRELTRYYQGNKEKSLANYVYSICT